jgi:hypothetical protein
VYKFTGTLGGGGCFFSLQERKVRQLIKTVIDRILVIEKNLLLNI